MKKFIKVITLVITSILSSCKRPISPNDVIGIYKLDADSRHPTLEINHDRIWIYTSSYPNYFRTQGKWEVAGEMIDGNTRVEIVLNHFDKDPNLENVVRQLSGYVYLSFYKDYKNRSTACIDEVGHCFRKS